MVKRGTATRIGEKTVRLIFYTLVIWLLCTQSLSHVSSSPTWMNVRKSVSAQRAKEWSIKYRKIQIPTHFSTDLLFSFGWALTFFLSSFIVAA